MRNSYVYFICRNIYICDLINFRSRYIQYNSHNFEQMYRQIIFNASIYVLIHWQWCFALALSVIYLLLISKKNNLQEKSRRIHKLTKCIKAFTKIKSSFRLLKLKWFCWKFMQLYMIRSSKLSLTLLCNYFYSEFFLSKKKSIFLWNPNIFLPNVWFALLNNEFNCHNCC